MAAARCSSFPALCVVVVVVVVLIGGGGAESAADQEGLKIHLHFYFHEVNAGTPNATVLNVASLHRNSSTFGDLNVFDNALRAGPDPASRLVGRAQGLALHASLDESGGLTAITFAFSDYGAYSGTTLATLGHIGVSGPAERSIVGGTGKLRFARGYMVSSLLSSTDTSIVVVFDMYFTLAR
ncbi:pterocarpan synthase 1-like [Triticum dicoccoides]|uniref:pterocarpan synthase 1-like n=1 Tax=Triticum dicoccoides TaxID=85692 RepID=UPI000E7B0E4E|nr:pterocarpan synthase 1-like [Triticum dicoccoides]